MTQANSQCGGTAIAVPDVCLAGAVPVPSTNTASGAMGSNPSTNVYINNGAAHPKGTITSSTSGSAGSGVSSGTCNSKSQCTGASDKVLVNGKGATRMGDTTKQNSCNASGSQATPSQTKVHCL